MHWERTICYQMILYPIQWKINKEVGLASSSHVESGEPDEAEEGEDPDALVLVGAPPLDEQPREVLRALGQRRVERQHRVHVLQQRRHHRRLGQDGQQPHQLHRVQLQ